MKFHILIQQSFYPSPEGDGNEDADCHLRKLICNACILSLLILVCACNLLKRVFIAVAFRRRIKGLMQNGFTAYFFNKSRISVSNDSSLVGAGGPAGSTAFSILLRIAFIGLTTNMNTASAIKRNVIAD